MTTEKTAVSCQERAKAVKSFARERIRGGEAAIFSSITHTITPAAFFPFSFAELYYCLSGSSCAASSSTGMGLVTEPA